MNVFSCDIFQLAVNNSSGWICYHWWNRKYVGNALSIKKTLLIFVFAFQNSNE